MSCSATEDKRRSQSCPFTRQQAAACASYASPRGGDGPGVLGLGVVGPSPAPASASSVPLTGVSEQRAAPTHRLQPLMLHPNANTRELLCPARDNAINNALCTSVYVSAFRPADSIIPGVNKTPDMNQCCCRIQTKPRGNAFPGRNLEPSSFFSVLPPTTSEDVPSPDQPIYDPARGPTSRAHLVLFQYFHQPLQQMCRFRVIFCALLSQFSATQEELLFQYSAI